MNGRSGVRRRWPGASLFGIWLALTVCLSSVGESRAQPPLSGPVSSPFGWRIDPLNGSTRFHAGVDIAAEYGAPVVAAQAGYVVYSGEYGGYGEVVVLDHGRTLYTLYGHNSERLVEAGQYVVPGQIIARVGATGRATGPHLHFEVHYNRQYVDPLVYLGGAPTIQIAQPARLSPDSGGPPVPTSQAAATPAISRKAVAAASAAESTSPPIPTTKIRRESRRLLRPRSAYGRSAVEVVRGSEIETVEF
jgi:murein DD-endopeptidase MepM/ murein hydrolase activator NlpD